jgi:type II secretory pathway pseudopilin PulG
MIRGKKTSSQRRAAFTMLEMMIAAMLTGFVVAGVLTTFLMINRTSFAAGNYSQIESETRRALEVFGEDVRVANDVHWNDSQSVTLTLPIATDTSPNVQVLYAYDSTVGSPTQGCFYRLLIVPGAQPKILLRNVTPDFAFQRYRLTPPGGGSNEATTDAETKQLQVMLKASVRAVTTAAASQTAFSASFILRNKHVSH